MKNKYIQSLRGIGIIIVVMSHAISISKQDIFLKNFYEIIIQIHMSIFFIISGYLYGVNEEKYKKDKKEFFIQKFKHILIPYLFYTCILWTIIQIGYLNNNFENLLFNNGFSSMNLKDLFINIFTYQKYYTQHLWFLYVLFIYYMIAIFLFDKIKNKSYLVYFSIFANILVECFDSQLYIIQKISTWMFFFILGYSIVKISINKVIQLGKKYIGSIIILTTISIVMHLLIKNNFILENNFFVRRILLEFLRYIIGSFSVFLIYSLIKKYNNNEINIINKVGDYSYGIYLIHNPYFVGILGRLAMKVFNFNSYIFVILFTIIGVFIPYYISKYIILRSRILSCIMLGISNKKG